MSKNKLSSLGNHGTTTTSSLSSSSSSSISNNTSIAKIIFVFSNILKLVQSIPIGHITHGNVGGDYSTETKRPVLTPEEFYMNLFTSIFLVLAGGVFAGLTLGLMGQDEVYLKVIAHSGDSTERKHAKKVLQLIGRGKHWVLVTLLLSNVITNETLPIVLDRCLGGGWPAVVTSTVSIVIFGEIIPQSICVRYGLQVGSLFAPFVLVLMYIMYPVAYPCAMLLDHILGEDHGTVYKKSGLKTLVTLHKTMGVERLNQDEVTIISAVLDLKEKPVSSIMTPMDRVYTMSADALLDEKTVEEIFNAGFSRIPIHLPNEPTNFIGMLLVRVLISYDPEDALPVASFPLATLPETGLDTSCLNILNYFQEGKSHMIVVSENPGEPTGAVGVLTLEDVIEELIGEEIVDESDVYIDINKNIKRKHPGPLAKRNLTSYLHTLYQRNSSSNPNSKRNSIDSSVYRNANANANGNGNGGRVSPPLDISERLRQGSESSQISYTTNNNNTKNRKQQDQNEVAGAAAATTTATATATAATNWKPKNPASNPLETKKKFVTIKRPDQDKIESMKKITSPKLVPTQVGTIYSTEKGALEEAHRRSLDEREHGPKFLLPMEREGDVSEINQQNYHGENGSHHHIDIPMNGNGNGNDNHNDNHNQANHSNGSHTGNIDIPIPEYQESRSYKTGGIVESVVNVQGVLKVIIENVTDADDDEDEIALAIENLSSNDNNNKKHKLKKSKKSKKKLKKSPSSTLKSVTTSLNDDDVNDDQTVEQTQSLLHSGNGSRNSSIGSNTSNNK